MLKLFQLCSGNKGLNELINFENDKEESTNCMGSERVKQQLLILLLVAVMALKF